MDELGVFNFLFDLSLSFRNMAFREKLAALANSVGSDVFQERAANWLEMSFFAC